MKNLYTLFLLVLSIIVSSCANKQELKQKDEAIDSLQTELNKLKETPESYFLFAHDYYKNGNFIEAIKKLESIKNRFPSSNYSKDHIAAEDLLKSYRSEENSIVTEILNRVKSINANESIELIQNTLSKYSFSKDLNTKLIEALERNRKLYEKQKALVEAQQKIGIEIISIESYWKSTISNDYNELLVPELKIKVKNISGNDIKELKVKATFVQSNNEVLGTDTDYTIYYGDTPLRPNQIKLAIVSSEIGYLDPLGIKRFDLPDVKAEIYINDVFYKSVWIKKDF